jgi:transposase
VQIDPDALPEDTATLHLMLRMILLQQGALAAENDKMRLLIQRLTRHQFGRRSEQLTPDQLQLALEELEQTIAANQAGQDSVAAAAGLLRKPRAEAPGRNHGALPAHLPRYEVVVDVEDRACPCCGHTLHAIGELRTEQLDIVPSQLRVRVTRRPRYACHGCEGAVVVAPAPDRPVDGGMPTEALVAHVVVSKFADSLPLYRQAQMLERQGIKLDRSTLANWVGRACWWLTPLYELMLGTVLGSSKVFADDTTLPVLDPGRGRTKTGRLWCYAVDDRPWNGPGHPMAAYVYSDDRKNERPAGHLAGFRGVLQVDGYSGFKALSGARTDASVTLAFCWSHMRRHFYDQFVSDKSPRRPRCWRGSARCMPSKPRSAATRPNTARPYARSEAGRSWRRCTPGCMTKSGECPARPTWPARCATQSGTGPGWWCSSTTAEWRWTPMWWNGQSGPIP